MLTCRYLHRKRNHYYFRRRIPGFSTKITPISLALGTTDPALGHIWVGHLSQEFDRMFDSFLLLTPPLPDDLVARYFERCLSENLFTLRRQTRMARMMGRFRDGQERLELMKLVHESLLQDGLQSELPLSRIDPEWSLDTLDDAVHLYVLEVCRLSSC